MLKVGITGGIGSGKTWVCRIFQHLGVPLFEADLEVKKLYSSDKDLKTELIRNFGQESYDENGAFNTSFFRSILKDETKRSILNNIVHPRVFERFESWSLEQTAPYVIKEAAILFESGADRTVHKTIGVFAPIETRINRVIERDNRSRTAVLDIIKMQMSDEELRKRVDYTITNDNENSVIKQVRDLHQVLINEARHF